MYHHYPHFSDEEIKTSEVKQLAQDLLLENNKIPEAEHLTTISHCISEIKVKEDEGGNGRYRNG